MLFMSCVFRAFASVHCCPVVTRCERADLLALVCEVFLWIHFFGICVCFCHTVMSVSCSLVVTCLERADLLTF